jgi:hypothetical protein
MTDPDDRPVYRHPAVYRTARGTTLSGGREAAGTVRAAVQPVRISETVSVRRGIDPDAIEAVTALERAPEPAPEPAPESESVSTQDDSAGLYELRRYAEPND